MKWVSAQFRNGDYVMNGIPTNYRRYVIGFNGIGDVTSADLVHMFQWKEARSLEIDSAYYQQIAYKLQLHIDDMSQMTNLSALEMKISRKESKKISVKSFSTKLPSLKAALFYLSLFTYEEAREFIEIQCVPDKWMSNLQHEHEGKLLVVYRKKWNSSG